MYVIIGYVAATLTTFSFLPQALKTIKTKSTTDLSLSMYFALFIGMICWLIYGIILEEGPIIIANVVTLVFTGIILFNIIKNKKKIRSNTKAY